MNFVLKNIIKSFIELFQERNQISFFEKTFILLKLSINDNIA